MEQTTQTITVAKQEDEVSLRDMILNFQKWAKYLLSKWYLILAFGILGAGIGYWYAASKKPVYTATTTFVLETGEKGGLGQYAGLASMVGIDIGGGGGDLFQGDNIMELYKSRTMIERSLLSPVAESGNNELLIHRYIAFNGLRKKWKDKAELRNISFTPANKYAGAREQLLHDSIMGIVVKDINKNYLTVAKPDKKLSIVKVDVKAKDELFAKAFNEQLVARVNDFYITTKTKKSLENVAILQRKADSVRWVMTGAIYRAARVVDATPNLNPTRQAQRAAPVQSAQVSAEVNKEVLPELIKNLELSKISLSKDTPLIQVVDEPVLPLNIDRISKLKAVIIGGMLLGILSIVILWSRKTIKNLVRNESL
ncbi:MAG: lipopolysaccharide biosynthesis protein [Sphingobacteriales bacterium 41-5]|nr:MAG: lipopolysaccharide biosynthesis protein [Niabella sp. SCN 42-15]OJU28225.1 MAG: lipopolysaccharide biosynthesis protein [Sphingobacteriales bacterium 41-5]